MWYYSLGKCVQYGDSIAEWLRKWTCNLEVLGSSLPRTLVGCVFLWSQQCTSSMLNNPWLASIQLGLLKFATFLFLKFLQYFKGNNLITFVTGKSSLARRLFFFLLITFLSFFLQKLFHDRTPYTIMFGPDKCGEDKKVISMCSVWSVQRDNLLLLQLIIIDSFSATISIWPPSL